MVVIEDSIWVDLLLVVDDERINKEMAAEMVEMRFEVAVAIVLAGTADKAAIAVELIFAAVAVASIVVVPDSTPAVSPEIVSAVH